MDSYRWGFNLTVLPVQVSDSTNGMKEVKIPVQYQPIESLNYNCKAIYTGKTVSLKPHLYESFCNSQFQLLDFGKKISIFFIVERQKSTILCIQYIIHYSLVHIFFKSSYGGFVEKKVKIFKLRVMLFQIFKSLKFCIINIITFPKPHLYCIYLIKQLDINACKILYHTVIFQSQNFFIKNNLIYLFNLYYLQMKFHYLF